MSTLVLGIETSCDDTAAAVIEDGRHALSSIIASQLVHHEFGGVVPELASRAHLDLLGPTVDRALTEARVTLDDVNAIAVTRGPGLLGSLVVGVAYAKALALAADRPLVGVNHIEAHIWAAALDGAEIPAPFVGAALSGGHTEFILAKGFGEYALWGATRDDAAGEAFDKVAKLLGLGFPGGPVIDRLAADGDARAFDFPRAMTESGDYDVSFSGLKTAVRQKIGDRTPPFDPKWLADLCASFQAAVVETLTTKILRLATDTDARAVVVGGGVASNRALRAALAQGCVRLGIPAIFPAPKWCTDNAAMIGLVGSWMLARGEVSGSELEPVANLEEMGFALPALERAL
ncbi:MAG TPA: tRNA (adenosine(37)-N6)-threonylcarbamoyltransferase complex transferase subunit TsaD [Candidatus Eisenbacteria bacterium]|nr:tRNA (adenosine(37)-N6)-threonylcarbamoyltransferase complex transferase subunit TsaD [Candidatus Eisenbacteria bacterium]